MYWSIFFWLNTYPILNQNYAEALSWVDVELSGNYMQDILVFNLTCPYLYPIPRIARNNHVNKNASVHDYNTNVVSFDNEQLGYVCSFFEVVFVSKINSNLTFSINRYTGSCQFNTHKLFILNLVFPCEYNHPDLKVILKGISKAQETG